MVVRVSACRMAYCSMSLSGTPEMSPAVQNPHWKPWARATCSCIGASAPSRPRPPFAGMYWTIAQQLAHLTASGASLRTGDLYASGTVSGPERGQRGCLLELTWRGTEPVTLPGGETRAFLADGDELTLRGWCERDGAVRIGFGEAVGVVVGEETQGG